jgi:hypothetical protein
LKHIYRAKNDKSTIEHQQVDKNKKHLVIMFADAIAEPWAMMVKFLNTRITFRTMHCFMMSLERASRPFVNLT